MCVHASSGGYIKLFLLIPKNLEAEWQAAENFNASTRKHERLELLLNEVNC